MSVLMPRIVRYFGGNWEWQANCVFFFFSRHKVVQRYVVELQKVELSQDGESIEVLR